MHPPHWDRATDVEEARLLLRVDADMVAPECRGQLTAGRLQRERGALVEGRPEPLGTELLG